MSSEAARTNFNIFLNDFLTGRVDLYPNDIVIHPKKPSRKKWDPKIFVSTEAFHDRFNMHHLFDPDEDSALNIRIVGKMLRTKLELEAYTVNIKGKLYKGFCLTKPKEGMIFIEYFDGSRISCRDYLRTLREEKGIIPKRRCKETRTEEAEDDVSEKVSYRSSSSRKSDFTVVLSDGNSHNSNPPPWLRSTNRSKPSKDDP